MIFVTVGTHEQPLDRLFQEIEKLAAEGTLSEPIRVQSGYTQYVFSKCQASSLMPFQDLQQAMIEASIVICHGGPATILQARMNGKMPVVIPRQHQFGEHVNDHQVDFCKRLEKEGQIIAVYDIGDLATAITRASTLQNDDIGSQQTSAYTKAPPKKDPTRAPTVASVDELCRRLTEYCASL